MKKWGKKPKKKKKTLVVKYCYTCSSRKNVGTLNLRVKKKKDFKNYILNYLMFIILVIILKI